MTERSRAEELYDDFQATALEWIKSSTETFDNNLLTFSSGALGLSLAFIKDVVPIGKAIWLPLLYISWVAFSLCIFVTLASFRVSIRALETSLPYAQKYYLKGERDAFNQHLKTRWSRAVTWCTVGASTCFALGVVCTVLFAGSNIRREAKRMAEKENAMQTVPAECQKGLKPAAMAPLNEGLKPVGMVPTTDGLRPAAMTPTQQVPTTATTPTIPATESGKGPSQKK